MRKRKNILASIDLGAAEIKLLVAKKGMGGVKTLLEKTFPREDLQALSQTIQQYRPKEVILLLPQERVIVRDLTIPPVDKTRIKSILFFELSGLLPYAMEQVELDYLLVQRTRKELKVKAFVIPTHLLKEIQPLSEAGIGITRILPRGLAVMGYCIEKKLTDRIVKVSGTDGELVLYPELQKYFVQYYASGQAIDEGQIKESLQGLKAEPARWDFLGLSQTDVELLGAVYFHLKHRKFTLFRTVEEERSINWVSVGIGLTILAMLIVNGGTLYLKYVMKKSELAVYDERMKMLEPRVEKVKKLKTEVTTVKERFEKLEKMEDTNRDYLIWLKELHMLLQEDTQVSILVFEGDALKELHGKAPSATRVSERLSKSAYFSSPEFTSPLTNKVEDGVQVEEFSITAKLVNPKDKEEGKNE